jgi:hypothetical protein
MSVESDRIALDGSKANGSFQPAAAQHSAGGEGLNEATPIPRNTPRENSYGPANRFCCVDLLWSHCGRTLCAARAEPSGDATKRNAGQSQTRDE